jgi:hypothetical protein
MFNSISTPMLQNQRKIETPFAKELNSAGVQTAGCISSMRLDSVTLIAVFLIMNIANALGEVCYRPVRLATDHAGLSTAAAG